MPFRTVRMSSRDPAWMTQAKSRIGPNNVVRLREINRRISELVSKNRRNLLQAPIGTREWWKQVDNLSQRRCRSAKVTLDKQSLVELNDYFADLCWDTAYKQPTPAQVENGVQALKISERQVWNYLRLLKKTATGPDDIPFWVWKDQAEIFTPIICKIWNLSLKFSTWPSSWKRAHVTPLPKVDVPKGKDRLQRDQHYSSNCACT